MRHHRAKALGILIALSSMASVLSGCSSGASSQTGSGASTTGAPTSEATTTTSMVNLSSMLLAVSNLPTGWSVDNSGPPTGINCVQNLFDPFHPSQKARVAFIESGSLPKLSETLVTFPSVASGFAEVKNALDNCKHVTISNGSQTAQATVGAMSFPAVGDSSAAYTETLTYEGVPAAQGIVIFRKGNVVGGVALGDIGNLDTGQFQQFVTAALAKITG